MRRMQKQRPSQRTALIYALALVALLAYALPRIPALRPGLPGTFSVLWIIFAGLALAANVYFFVGADKERSKMLEELETKKPMEDDALAGRLDKEKQGDSDIRYRRG